MKPKYHIDDLVKKYRPVAAKSKQKAWEELRSKFEKEVPGKSKFGWFLIAAVFLAVAVVCAVLADSFLFTQKYSTGFGEHQRVVLLDNSAVELNPGSVLKVNYLFLTGRRKLHLTGQALFDVEKGKTFTVKFKKGKVTALGTRFSIKTYKQIPAEVSCLSGKVAVSSGNEKKLLQSGEGVIIKDFSVLKPAKVKENTVLNEMNGKYSWQNKALKDIFVLFEAQLGYQVKAPQELLARKFTGEIDMNRPDSACEILSFAMDVNCSIDHQQKIISFENKN